MLHEVVETGALIASFVAIGTAVWVAGQHRSRTHASAAEMQTVPSREPSPTPAAPGTDGTPALDDPRSAETSRFALAACVFADARVEHLCWTAMVVDPALHDTPGHFRLVGHYETELAAVDAAAHLADALNECLIPGEARLTATALGIEPAVGLAENAATADNADTTNADTADIARLAAHMAHDAEMSADRDDIASRRAESPRFTNWWRRPERLSREPRSRFGLPIAYNGTPLAGQTVPTDLDDAPISHR